MTAPTYREVGATRGELPPGYQHLEQSRVIGHGALVFSRAAQVVMTWGVHRGAGLRVETTVPTAEVGGLVTVGVGFGPIRVKAPCVVVYVVDEPRQRGFAYGTLRGHPEQGEELFLVQHDDDDSVKLTIRAFSRPAVWWSRAGGPVTRAVQRLAVLTTDVGDAAARLAT